MPNYIFGVHPALETLQATPDRVERVFLAQGVSKGPLTRIVDAAQREGIAIESTSKERISRMAGGGAHQGVVLQVAEHSYVELPDVLEKAGSSGLVLVLDGIEDPHNLGALIRSGSALGVSGIVIPKDRAAGVTATVAKASAGAIAHMPIARVTNLSRALLDLKEAGFWISAADPDGDKSPEGVDMCGPTALVVGGEGQGIRRGVLEKCDFRIRIPLMGPISSLNASVAGAILLYEVSRQRRLANLRGSKR